MRGFFEQLRDTMAVPFSVLGVIGVLVLIYSVYQSHNSRLERYPVVQVTSSRDWSWQQGESNHLMQLLGEEPRTYAQLKDLRGIARQDVLACIRYVLDDRTQSSFVFVGWGFYPVYSANCTPQIHIFVKLYPDDVDKTEQEFVRATIIGLEMFRLRQFGNFSVDVVSDSLPVLLLDLAHAEAIASTMGEGFPSAFSPYSFWKEAAFGIAGGLLLALILAWLGDKFFNQSRVHQQFVTVAQPAMQLIEVLANGKKAVSPITQSNGKTPVP